jgi:hypothetical protein
MSAFSVADTFEKASLSKPYAYVRQTKALFGSLLCKKALANVEKT